MAHEISDTEEVIDEQPLCSSWQVWIGKEVEGETDRGEHTLFIRKSLTQRDLDIFFAQYRHFLREKNQRRTRIWFTKEFNVWGVLRYAKTIADSVCLEVEVHEYFPDVKFGRKLPFNLLYGIQLYVKIPIRLKQGDHICVGYAYEDEAFVVGRGRKVSPKDYRDDIKLL